MQRGLAILTNSDPNNTASYSNTLNLISNGDVADCIEDYYLYKKGKMELNSLYNKYPKIQIIASNLIEYSPQSSFTEEEWDEYCKDQALHLEISADALIFVCEDSAD